MRIIFAGGGTAGHINPAIAIAKHIEAKEPNADILFIGTQRGMEKSLVPREGFKIEYISVKGFRRKFSFDTILSIADLFKGLSQAIKIIRKYKPDIVVGTGGYVCGPLVFIAYIMKIPTIVHEQNAFPGVTIKILARFVDVVAISFVESKKYLNVKKKLIHTGNPIKQDILTKKRDDSRAEIGVDSRPFILAFGGSLGAERINEALIAYIRSTVNDNRVQLLFSTGEREYQNVSKKLKNSGIDLQSHRSIKIVPYIYKMDTAISGADLIISRAGAITLAEITAKGVPAILIPSPNVTNNHQEYNARVLERAKAAVVLLERDLSARTLKETIEKLLGDKDLLKDMASNSYKIGIRDATEKIYGEITALLK